MPKSRNRKIKTKNKHRVYYKATVIESVPRERLIHTMMLSLLIVHASMIGYTFWQNRQNKKVIDVSEIWNARQQLETVKTSSDAKVQKATAEYKNQTAKTVNFTDTINQKTK